MLLVAGCGTSQRDVDDDIALLVDEAARAAEAGEFMTLAGMISSDYGDDHGRDRRAMTFLVRAWLGRYPDLLVVLGDLEVEPVSTQLANARLTVTLVGRDGGRPLLTGVDADRLRLRLALRLEDGEWRVTRADWDGSGAQAAAHPD